MPEAMSMDNNGTVKRTVWHNIVFSFPGGSYTGVWFFDGQLLRLEVPNLLPMQLFATHATDYGSIELLYSLLNAQPISGETMLSADDVVSDIFFDALVPFHDYKVMRG